MDPKQPEPPPRRGRGDAHGTRQRIVEAAVDVIAEQEKNAPLELIARRARVRMATLRRHFPDRADLERHIAIDLFVRAKVEADSALAEEPDAFKGLVRYMHSALDMRISAVMSVLFEQFPLDEEFIAAREAAWTAFNQLVAAAHREGSLRSDVVSGDIGMLLARLARPLPGAFPPDVNRSLSHRHLELVLDGLLRVFANDGALPGPEMTIEDLAAMPPNDAVGRQPAGRPRLGGEPGRLNGSAS
jgi:AcrR family transcriptional regulator